MDVLEIVLIVANIVLTVAVVLLGRGLRDSLPPSVLPVIEGLIAAAERLANSTARTDDDVFIAKLKDALGWKPEAKPVDPQLPPLG